MLHQKLYLVYQYAPLALHIYKGNLTKTTSYSTLFTDQEVKLTDITLYPRLDSVRICLKTHQQCRWLEANTPEDSGHYEGQHHISTTPSHPNYQQQSRMGEKYTNVTKFPCTQYFRQNQIVRNGLT